MLAGKSDLRHSDQGLYVTWYIAPFCVPMNMNDTAKLTFLCISVVE